MPKIGPGSALQNVHPSILIVSLFDFLLNVEVINVRPDPLSAVLKLCNENVGDNITQKSLNVMRITPTN